MSVNNSKIERAQEIVYHEGGSYRRIEMAGFPCGFSDLQFLNAETRHGFGQSLGMIELIRQVDDGYKPYNAIIIYHHNSGKNKAYLAQFEPELPDEAYIL